MAQRGRPTSVVSLVGHFKSGPVAKDRLLVILANLACTIPVAEACRRLGLSRTLFRRLRRALLKAGLQTLEPRPRGRPVRQVPRHAHQIAQLEKTIAELQEDLAFARVREELALLVPWAGRRQKKMPRIHSPKPAGRRSMPQTVSGAGESRGPL